jgi:SAM-dependent methyltransferase
MESTLEQRIRAGSMDAADFLPQPSTNGHAPRKLNLGAGSQPLEGYENLDRKTGQEIFPLPFADDSVDEVRASHVLEHFSHRQVPDVLKEWLRVLKPNGVLKIAVPDFEWIARNYLAGQPIEVQGYVMGGHIDADDHHGCVFDREELQSALRKAGLYDIRPWKSEIQDCASLPVSLNLRGKKKGPLPKFKIHGAMSVPRLGFNDNFFCWVQGLAPLGILPCKYDGAFWGQCLERVMSDQLDAEYILTVDYDSAFLREDAEHLIRLAAEHPEADAIAPLQIRRAGESPLLLMEREGAPLKQIELCEFEEELVPVSTAHFGMTLIKTAALKKMPHPWFLGVPDKDGCWGEGHLDDDVYFWRKWQKTGNTLFLAPHVVIAHGEFVLKWPGKGNMQPVFQYASEFWKTGRPEGAWR